MQSDKLKQLPPYLFAELDRKKRELAAKGADIIDLSIGDPDLPTPPHIIDAICKAAHDSKNHRYPSYNGIQKFREAAADYLFHLAGGIGSRLDPDTEILALIGSKEGIAHAIWAFTNPGDAVLVPSPGYPVYAAASILAGCTPYEMPLKIENNFLPDFDTIPGHILNKARMMFLNYPNNPTSAVATAEFFKEAVTFARKHNIILCSDAAYIDIVYDGYKAPSVFEVEGAKDVAIEFYSLSKTYNMTGWRIGFAAGNRELIASLGKIKTNLDSSATAAVQAGAATALMGGQECVKETCAVYKERRLALVNGLTKLGWKVFDSKATFYVWVSPSPLRGEGWGEGDIASILLEKTHVAVTPGEGFGAYGKGYIRFSLTAPTKRIKEAVTRLQTGF